ncbi:LysR substrate-binding domain-containing protein [Vibrio sp. SCSIO 43137]|uniref:LysR substrate-binding domain-containing protein n=1 Tax=Vibrio sp. SCSIO 43137 TaxID=3021011 RepID=UPI002307B9BE|nr:LysR substrate-binding domain-containing protein [Vibrio sp. SCSIO 43137]WCE32402.1 LysR substrate-binding domain-containing protein [Vibrio sp. SCSIO 43137]
MDKLRSMQIFVYVVDNGSFRSACGYFNLSATMVGKHIQFLESSLGTKLINRTTRKQSLTESGELYYLECRRILDDIANAENQIQTLENSPQGTVRINSPVTFGNKVLAPIVVDFLRQYPSINVELTLNNHLIDPMHEQYDLVVRIGELTDSSLIARHLGDYQMIYCASQDYLNQHPPISHPDDLRQHNCLGFQYSESGRYSELLTEDNRGFRLSSNNGDILKYAAINGLGVTLQPELLLTEELESGRLTQILTSHTPKPSPIHLLYKDKQLSVKNRTFVEFVLASIRENK